EVPDVARAQPAVDDRLGRGVRSTPVAADEVGALEPDLAALAGLDGPVLLVADLHLQDGHGVAGARRVRDVVVTAVARAIGVGLGHAVADAQLAGREAVVHGLHEGRRGRRATARDVAQTRRVVLGEVGRR